MSVLMTGSMSMDTSRVASRKKDNREKGDEGRA